MSSKVVLEYILFFFLSLYSTQQSLNAYYSLVVYRPSEIISTINTSIQRPFKEEFSSNLPVDKKNRREMTASSNIIMAWRSNDGKQIKHHSLSQNEFNQLREIATQLSPEETNLLLKEFKEMPTEYFIFVLHNPQQKERLIRLTKFSSKEKIAKINSL